MNNDKAARTDVLDDDGAPQAAERRQAVQPPPSGDGKAKPPSQIPVPDANRSGA